jgi:hypothetical protein
MSDFLLRVHRLSCPVRLGKKCDSWDDSDNVQSREFRLLAWLLRTFCLLESFSRKEDALNGSKLLVALRTNESTSTPQHHHISIGVRASAEHTTLTSPCPIVKIGDRIMQEGEDFRDTQFFVSGLEEPILGFGHHKYHHRHYHHGGRGRRCDASYGHGW